MITSDEFFRRIYEDHATVSGTGSKRQVKGASGTTKVDTSPETKIDGKTTDGKGFGRSYDKSNRPNEHRPGKVEQAPQPYSPSNPQSRWKDSWAKAGLEASTRAAKSRQSGNYKNRQN